MYFQFIKFNSKLAPISSMNSKNKQIVVCMTGFTQNPKLEEYQKQIKSIGCKFIEQLAQGTDILLVDNTCTEKYKIAKLKKNMTECLTIKWLEDSVRAQKAVQIKQEYKLPNIFYGIKIGIYGYQNEESKKLQTVIQKNGGKFQAITNSLDNDINVIVVKKKQFRKLGIGLEIEIPLVGLDWIEESIKHQICKYPLDYSLNYFSLIKNTPVNNLERLKRKLTLLTKGSLLDNRNQFLNSISQNKVSSHIFQQQCIIYIDPNTVDENLHKILKKLICVCGGMYTTHNNPCITHILVGNITEEQYNSKLNYGNIAYILRVQWIIDSILFVQKLPQVDYKVRSFKKKFDQNYAHHVNIGKKRKEQFSQTFIKQNKGENRKSVSDIQILQTKSLNLMKSKSKCEPVKTTIFKNKYFLIDQVQKKDREMQGIVTKIRQNCGIIYDKPIKDHMNYIVLNDSSKNIEIVQSLMSEGKKFLPVSFRWINMCISKRQFIDPNKQNHFVFKPFKFKTPCSQLTLMKIEIIGLKNDLQKIRYMELLNALGSNKLSPNKVDITHCLCGQNYKEDPKFDQIRSENTNVKFIKIDWLKESLQNGIKSVHQFQMLNLQS